MNRRRGGVTKNLKDYIVPIIGGILVLILIFSMFSGDSSTTTIPETDLIENQTGVMIELDSSFSEASLVYPGDKKVDVTKESKLYKGEKIIVKNGSVSLAFPNLSDFKLNKLAEFKYLENGDFSLFSGDLWADTKTDLNIDMRFAKVKIGANSHVSLSQNEMGSSVYLISGFAEVSNLSGKSTVLAANEKVTVTRIQASKDDIDLSLSKKEIDDYFIRSDWFILNNGAFFLNSNKNEEESATGSTSKVIPTTNQVISFNNLSDQTNVSSDSININGAFTNTEIIKIVLNGSEAKINKTAKTFTFEGVDTSSLENDLVFKVYDDANDMLSRFVYTVYYDGAVSKNTGAFKVKTFDVDGSKFIFTTIKDGVSKTLNGKTTYTTYGDFLTIYGSVKIEGVKKVIVNGYTLKSFNGTSWRYHPSTLNNNLEMGTNVYEVKYLDVAGKLIYTNHFTIIKKEIVAVPVTKKETEKISGEATIN